MNVWQPIKYDKTSREGRISKKCKEASSRERGRLARFPNHAGGTPTLLWFALFGHARSGKSGFSLIEVTIAIGIVSFAMVTLMGVIPIGLIATQDAMQQTARSHIIKQISSDLGMLRFAEMPNYLGSNQYYDYEGNRLAGANTNNRIYIATMTNALPSYPGSSNLSNLDERFERVTIKIRRIAESTNAESRTTLAVFNASGKP